MKISEREMEIFRSWHIHLKQLGVKMTKEEEELYLRLLYEKFDQRMSQSERHESPVSQNE